MSSKKGFPKKLNYHPVKCGGNSSYYAIFSSYVEPLNCP